MRWIIYYFPRSHHRRCAAAVIGSLLILFIASSGLSKQRGALHQVTDQVGRIVTAPVYPERVVALAPSVTEMIFALNCQTRLVGATLFSNWPPEAKSLPRVGSYIRLDVERVAALSPDLLIAVRDGNPKAAIDQLQSLGLPVFAVNPQGLSSIMTAITALGNLLKAESAARTIVSDMRYRIDRVVSRIETAASRPRVFFQIGMTPIVSVGSGFIHELIETAGGLNVTAGKMTYPRLNVEDVISLAPDIIIITGMASPEQSIAAMEQWRKWPGIPAVKNGRVHVENADIFNRPTPRLVDALETLARLVHPGLFGS